MADQSVPANTRQAIENTSERDPLLHLLGMMDGDTTNYITSMESQGQRQLVNSTSLPTEILHCAEADITALGITLGPVNTGDPLFREATLPEGWSKKTTDHAMWSKVVDEHGRPRLSIFYKAAFYDRKAHMSVETVYSYAGALIDGAPLFLDEWATGTAVIEAIGRHRDRYVEYAEGRDEDGYWAGQIDACDRAVQRVSAAIEAAAS